MDKEIIPQSDQETKVCKTCNEIKSLNNFQIRKGLYKNHCKECVCKSKRKGSTFKLNKTPFSTILKDPVTGEKFKKCASCKIIKSVSEYSIQRHSDGVLRSKCKECLREYYTSRRRAKGIEPFVPANRLDPELNLIVRRCRRCDTDKTLDNFNWRIKHKGNLTIYCKPCLSEIFCQYYNSNAEAQRKRVRDYQAKNPEIRKAYQIASFEKRRQYHLVHSQKPEVKARRLAAGRKRWQAMSLDAKRLAYERNREKILERNRAWDKSHPETRAAWRKNNKHRLAEYRQRRRARLNLVTPEPIDRNKVIERDGFTCYLCGKLLQPEEVTLDHVIPLKKGGSHTYENLKVACRPCNGRKKDRWLSDLDWAKKN